MVKLLTAEEREKLRDIFETVFDSELPDEEQANIIGYVEDGEIKACVTAEVLFRTDMWYVSPRHRKTTKGAKMIAEMIRFLFRYVPTGHSVIVFADDDRKASLLTRLGFREIKGRTFRLDR